MDDNHKYRFSKAEMVFYVKDRFKKCMIGSESFIGLSSEIPAREFYLGPPSVR